MKITTLLIALAMGLSLLCAPAFAATSWNIANDFVCNNANNSPWFYGTYAFGSAPTALPDSNAFFWGTFAGYYDSSDAHLRPAIGQNGGVQNGWVMMSPDGDNGGEERALVAFIAPQTGLYNWDATFLTSAGWGCQSIYVGVGGKTWDAPHLNGYWNGFGMGGDATWSPSGQIQLNQGEPLWFDVHVGAGSQASDSDIVFLNGNVSLVPEPGTFVALASSLIGFAGFGIRRRK